MVPDSRFGKANRFVAVLRSLKSYVPPRPPLRDKSSVSNRAQLRSVATIRSGGILYALPALTTADSEREHRKQPSGDGRWIVAVLSPGTVPDCWCEGDGTVGTCTTVEGGYSTRICICYSPTGIDSRDGDNIYQSVLQHRATVSTSTPPVPSGARSCVLK